MVRNVFGIFGINDNHIRTPRRNEDEVWVRNLVGFAARGVNLVGYERHSPIEFANGFDDHDDRIISQERLIKQPIPGIPRNGRVMGKFYCASRSSANLFDRKQAACVTFLG